MQQPSVVLKPIDRRQLRDHLRAMGKVFAKIGSERMKAFLRDNEIELPVPSLILSAGMRSMLLSRMDRLVELEENDLRNVLAVIRWGVNVALGEADPDLKPHKNPWIRGSLDRALEVMLQGATADLLVPDEDPAQLPPGPVA